MIDEILRSLHSFIHYDGYNLCIYTLNENIHVASEMRKLENIQKNENISTIKKKNCRTHIDLMEMKEKSEINHEHFGLYTMCIFLTFQIMNRKKNT